MKKFLVTYHSPANAMEEMARNATPEQQAAGMQAWMNWAQRVGDKLVDLGAPLMNGQQVGLDGNFKNSNREVSGYSILNAENMEEAKSLLQGHPHLGEWNPEATIEVHEAMPIPGM